jgi:hypothetical protein
MHGWYKCSDGRLYHPVVAEIALRAWERKLRKRYNTECARIKKHNQRHSTDVPYPEYDVWISSGCVPIDLSPPRPAAVPKKSRGTKKNVPGEKGSKGEGEGEGYSNSKRASLSSAGAERDQSPDEVQQALDHYAALRRDLVPNGKAIDFNQKRCRAMSLRLGEIGGLPAWDETLAIIRSSPFLRGETSRNGFVAEIDWILNPANLTKVREGNYSDSRPASSAQEYLGV